MFRRRAPVVIVLVPTASATTFATDSARRSVSTAVAVDPAGHCLGFGEAAVLAAARRRSRVSLLVPFSHRRIESERATADYLNWLVGEAGCRRREVILAPVVAATGHEALAGDWRRAVAAAGLRSIVLSRPLAAVVGMGVDVESSAAQMTVDLVDGIAEVAVLSGGQVQVTRSCSGTDPGEVAAVVRSILIQLDPDLEQDIVDAGLRMIGGSIPSGWGEELGRRAHLPVSAVGDAEQLVLEGARRTVESLRPYLRRLASSRPRFRAVPAGF